MDTRTLSSRISASHKAFAQACAKSCRSTILQMTAQAGSGHPGGSLSSIDYLSLLYTSVIVHTGEPVIISNGHIAPAVYAVLAEMGYIPKNKVIAEFRKNNSIFEGHVSREVPGVWYGTGPLGIGVSVAAGVALGYKLQHDSRRVYALMGDGEGQEGQVYEMMNFASKYRLDNLIVYMDYNQVQLSDAVARIMPYDPKKLFTAAGWKVLSANGHDMSDLWSVLHQAHRHTGSPTLILGRSIMGKGVDFMEKDGRARRATWHGKAPQVEEITDALESLALAEREQTILARFRKQKITYKPKKSDKAKQTSAYTRVKSGTLHEYVSDELVDCRSAYGHALLDLAQHNPHIVALSADLSVSVKTDMLANKFPERHIECGVAEQAMVSISAGLDIAGLLPFCSTFGVFMTSRAKDQARVNDINNTNVKMIATHAGLSVGEDGPTHQAIDDAGSMLGLLHTVHLEPADANHTDRLVRFAARHHGNVYMRMGRHKLPILTKQDGSLLYDKKYSYTYGKADRARVGTTITIIAIGGTAIEALRAWELLRAKGTSAEVVIASSIKAFDDTIFSSIEKTGAWLSVEDHNPYSGLGAQIARECALRGVGYHACDMLGVESYQRSGTATDLYQSAGIDAKSIVKKVRKMVV